MSLLSSIKIKNAILVLLLVCCYFLLFHKLDTLPTQIWDESRNAVNAIEMFESNNFLVRTFDNTPDMYELKPPLLIWLDVMWMHLLGPTDLAMRITPALAGLAIALFIFFFIGKRSNKYFGFLAALTFVSSIGVLGPHMFRFGDHDGLLIFFLTGSMFATWHLTEKMQPKWIIIFFICILGGVFTKSIIGLTFLPATSLWLLFNNRLRAFLKHRFTIWLMVGVLAFIGVFYYLHEIATPGYLMAVYDGELIGRYTNTAEKATFKEYSFFYYGINLFDRFKPMLFFIPLMLHALVFKRDKLSMFLLLFSTFYWLIISGGTKNFWYDGPLFPILSMFTVYHIFIVLKTHFKLKLKHYAWLVIIPSIYLFTTGFRTVANPKCKPWDVNFYKMGWELRDYLKAGKICNKTIVMSSYNTHLKYYTKALNNKAGHVVLKRTIDVLVNDTICIAEPNVYKTLEKKFKLVLIDSTSRTKDYIIKKRGDNPIIE